MFRRSTFVLAKQAGRTIVRDPRKASKAAARNLPTAGSDQQTNLPPPQPQQPPPLPFEPSQQNQQSLGSSMASYALAGVGVALGVTLVRVVLGF